MFSFQTNFALPCLPCTKEEFYRLVNSVQVQTTINEVRACQERIDRLPKSKSSEKTLQNLETKKAKAKKRLPGLIFQARFVATKSKKGTMGCWRKNSAAVLNGLFMLDIDHLDRDALRSLRDKLPPYYGTTILLVFVTPSGHGMKIVAKAQCEVGNIEANQRELAARLGVAIDTACKDAARLSFCPSVGDIIYINDELFAYDNPAYDHLYGEQYRSDNRQVAPLFDIPPMAATAEEDRTATEEEEYRAATAGETATAADPSGHDPIDELLHNGFSGVSYEKIANQYVQLLGAPAVGARHQWLLKMAKNMRYICDFNAQLLARVLLLSAPGKEVSAERGRYEIEKIAEAACGYSFFNGFPKEIREVCSRLGIDLQPKNALQEGEGKNAIAIDYAYWWNRLKALLPEHDAYTDAVAHMDDINKLGGVLAAGAMYGTYLTRCQFPFYDGKNYKFSYIVYIIGHAASGKSFIIDMDKELMAAIKRQDESYRQMEREYKEQKERMITSSKEAKEKAPQRPHYPVRYVPSTISNAKLYARLQDAVDLEDDTLHLHLFTLESELATALRVQVGSWAGKLDLELKSFQNEYAGVDYANDLSANGLIQVNWNQVISGTMDALKRKMRGGSITDGYITRMALWLMPNSEYTMIEKKYSSVEVDTPEEAERKNRIKQRVVALDQLRCVFSQVQRLSDHCWDWCSKQCQIAELEQDLCVEYFRKRIPLYMMRYTLPRVVCRQLDKFEGGYLKEGEQLEVTDDDLEFASLIGDYLLFISIYQWGQAYEESVYEEQLSRKPRLRKSKLSIMYASLPLNFSFDDVRKYHSNDNAARMAISRLVKAGIVEKTQRQNWRKLRSSIDDIAI